MATVHGRRGKVNVSATQVLSVYSFSYDASADQVDVTSMGDTSKSYLTGLIDGSGTVEARLNTTDWASGEGQKTVYDVFASGGTVALQLITDASTTGSHEFYGLSGSPVITSFAISQSFDDAVNVTFGFQGVLTPYSGSN